MRGDVLLYYTAMKRTGAVQIQLREDNIILMRKHGCDHEDRGANWLQL